MTRVALKVIDAEVRYGAIRAVQGVSITANSGAITAVVGTNGAGKSSLMRAIAGVTPMAGGRVEIPAGSDITPKSAYQRVMDLGVSLVPENRGILYQMTVEENLDLGAAVARRRGGGANGGSTSEMLELFPVLGERRRQLAGDLSGGEQQMLTIARALLTDPTILLLDEPSMGLAPLIIEAIFEQLLRFIRERDFAVVLVEQNTELALEVSDFTYVIERGKVTLEGPSAIVAQHPVLRQTYLGM